MAPVDVAPVDVVLTDEPVEVDPIGDSVAVSDAADTDAADGGRGGLNPLPWWRSSAADGALSDTDPVIAPIAVVADSPAPSEITDPELVTSETTVATVSPTLFSTPVLATPAQVVSTASISIAQLLDRAADWLSSLPANPVTDFLSGALLLVRRTLLPGVPNIPSARVANTWAVEGSPGATTEAVFTVTLGRAYDTPITLSYATTAPSPLGFVRNLLEGDLVDAATPGQDFTAQTGTLTFAPGQTSQQVSITVLGDAVIERNEIFGLTVYAEVPSGLPTPAAATISASAAAESATTTVVAGSGEARILDRFLAEFGTTKTVDFVVKNLTQYPVEYQGGASLGPTVGSVLQPGQTAVFKLPEIQWRWRAPNEYVSARNTPELTETATYKAVGSPVTYTANFNLEYTTGGRGPAVFSPYPQFYEPAVFLYGGTTCSSSGATCRSGGALLAEGVPTFYPVDIARTVTLLDNPDTKVTVGADNRKFQEQLLGLCDGGGADCKFAADKDGNTNQPKAPSRGYGVAHLPTDFAIVPNDTNRDITTTITMSDATAQATTWSTSASLKPKFGFIDKIVEATISASYGQTATTTHTFSQAIQVTVQPGETAYLFTATPVLRYSGTWTVTLGNTTFTLLDTYVDQPNPKGNPVTIPYTCRTGSDPCNDAQLGKAPAGLPGIPTPLAETTQGAGQETQTT